MASKFTHNICSCSSVGTCFGSFFCYPCLFGRTQTRLDNYPQAPSSDSEGWFGIPCLLMCCAAHVGFGCIPVWMQRSSMRKKLGIEGNGCTDCLASTFCTCCAMVQQEKEVKESAEKQALVGTMDGYQSAAGGMVYAPPDRAVAPQFAPTSMETGHISSEPPSYAKSS